MEYFDEKPEAKALSDTFISDNDDILGRRKEMKSFLEILDVPEENFTICLDGAWGSGKTFFVKQSQMILNGLNDLVSGVDNDANTTNDVKRIAHFYKSKTTTPGEEFKMRRHLAIYYDAWEHDDSDEPVLSLVASIIDQLNLTNELEGNPKILNPLLKLIDAIKGTHFADVGSIAIALLSPENILQQEQSRNTLKNSINDFIDGLIAEKADRCDIFIDELDRCNPLFAVKLLERVKHYFKSDRVTFIFSTNIEELVNTVQGLYGSGFDADRYLDRFFDLRTSLKNPQDLNNYLLSKGFDKNSSVYNEVQSRVIKYCQFTLREVNHYLKGTEIANGIYSKNYDLNDANHILHTYFVPILIGLKMKNLKEYDRFVNGQEEKSFISIVQYSLDDYCYKDLLTHEESKNYDATGDTSIVINALRRFYNAVFPIKDFDLMEGHFVMAGILKIRADNIDSMMRAVNIISGTPDIESIKK